MDSKGKPLRWMGNSYKELMALPKQVRRQFGYALGLAQLGERPIRKATDRLWRCGCAGSGGE